MAKVKDLYNNENLGLALGETLWYGKIVAPEALTLADFVYVEIPDFSPNHKFGPCRWPKSEVPDLGKECLVAFNNRQEPWVIAIW